MQIPFCLLLLLVAIPAARAAGPSVSPWTLCEQAIHSTEQTGHTPPHMLAAVAQVESGRPDPRTGAMRPWPWTIDVNGAGQFFATKAQAIAAVEQAQAQGIRSIDVGCMQVNLMHHPNAFASLEQAFDPKTNAAYAVRFLNALYAQTGDWPKSIAAYHSNTPQIAADYQRRVLAVWQQHQPNNPVNGNGLDTRYAAYGLVFGAFGSSGRVFGAFWPK